MKYLTMTGFTVRTGSDRWTLGYEGENNSRTLQIKTTDDLTDFATVNLLIDTLDCGAMTVATVGNFKVLSMVLTAAMLGEAGKKTCQLLMMDSEGTVIKKSNQFQMVVNASNTVDGMAPDSPSVIIITDYIEEKVNERISDEFLEGKINDWLDDHPEATTTVQDGSITDIKNNDSLKYLFYDDVTTETGRTSETDYYITNVPANDSNGSVISVYLDYDATNDPLEHAGNNMTTLTINGYGKVLVGGSYVTGIAIGKGEILSPTSLFGLVDDSYLYVGIKADRSITEYQMSSNVTPAQMLEDGCVNVFNSYFKLVENGQIVSGLSDGTITINGTTITETMRNPLMLMGVKANKDIVFMACDGRTAINKGLTYREAGELLISHGCTTVYNLDGGGSTTMIVRGSKINRDIDDNGTSIRDIHYTLNVKKQASNAATQSVYAKIGEEKQRLIEQIVPYVNNVQDSLLTKIGSAIPENDDLDDYLAEGKFYCSNATIAQSLSHCPVSIGFSMYCLQQGGTGRVLTQIIITNPSSGEQTIYYRSIVKDANGVFSSASDWGQFLPDIEVVTLTPEANVTINRSKCTKSARTVTISAVFTTSAETAKNSHLFAISNNAVPGTTVDIIVADTNAVINFAVAVSAGYINVSSLGPLPAGTYRMNVAWQV